MSKSKRVELPQNRRVAIYLRVAREDDDAITMQKSVLQDYAEKQGYMNISVYADNGVSGINFNRPALAQLEADIQTGTIGTVIVQNLSRIGRDYIKTEDWITGIRQKGVSFISVSDGIDDSTFDNTRPLTREFYGLYKEYLAAERRKKRRVMRRSG